MFLYCRKSFRGVSKQTTDLLFLCASYRQVVDSHAADGSAVVAEVVLDGRVGHLEQRDEEHEESEEEVFRSFTEVKEVAILQYKNTPLVKALKYYKQNVVVVIRMCLTNIYIILLDYYY